jgi:poly-gamma-glutamate capsule biosynthesis protein CapA/YwtB (metallophosphatase superfamily)
MRRSALGLLIVLGPFVALAVLYQLTTTPIDNSRPLAIPATGPVTIALAGDVLITDPLGAAERDQGFVAARSAVRSATFALANLEMNLLAAGESGRSGTERSAPWPSGSSREAAFLRELGFDALTLANDHAADYGEAGLLATRRVLDEAGLLHAGTGADLAEARSPLTAGRIAVFGVAVSSMADARATMSRADIKGRAGVSPLRYAADITVDEATFRTLRGSASALNAGQPAGERELMMSGTTIKKGDRTSVTFVVDQTDEREILEAIAAARRQADIIIVSVHAHEPSNASTEPAPFVQRFARAAIDAGAAIVVGHGPHRLRGVEVYGRGVILYSLGNFFYQPVRLDFRAANPFDRGANLFEAALGTSSAQPATPVPPNDPSWWHSVLAVATVDSSGVTGLSLIPLDLGTDKSLETRGIPRVVSAGSGDTLEHLKELSGKLGTEVARDENSEQIRVRLASP